MTALLAFIGSPLGKIAGYCVLALVLLATLAGVKHEWDLGQAARQQVHQIAAISHKAGIAVTAVDLKAGRADTTEQTRIVTRTRTLLQKVNVYVPVSTPCVPWGVVRLHDAAVLGVDPGTLQAPPGAADDACSPFTAAQLMAAVVANYGAADQNAQQLNDLETNLRDRATAVAGTGLASPAP